MQHSLLDGSVHLITHLYDQLLNLDLNLVCGGGRVLTHRVEHHYDTQVEQTVNSEFLFLLT